MNFTLRVYKDSYKIIHYDFDNITIGGITILSKRTKFDAPCEHNGNRKKFGYSMDIKGKFLKVAGSNSSPVLAFKGDYIDIELKNFPRYPANQQDYYVVKNILNSKNFDGNTKPYHYNNGFNELHYDILNLIA